MTYFNRLRLDTRAFNELLEADNLWAACNNRGRGVMTIHLDSRRRSMAIILDRRRNMAATHEVIGRGKTEFD
jgi:hypothetical protein